MVVTFKHSGDFNKTTKFLNFISKSDYIKKVIMQYGQKGVEALASATPVDTGLTAASWGFECEINGGSVSLVWTNTSENKSISIVYLLVNGHGTGTGGWVEGRDYINPAMQPVFDKIANDAWEEVSRL